jgi:predicted lipoprotein with Yx(FWY)xxD motif
MNTSWRSASLVATAAAVLALTTACGSQSGNQSAGSQNVGATALPGAIGSATSAPGNGYGADSTTAPSASASAGGQAPGQLAVVDNAKLGKIVTDGAGFTLYRFDQDTAEPPKSNCDGDCAKAWPPVPADGATVASGIDKSLLGEVTRADGTKQLTIAGWPMYRYAKDTKAGDINGEGVKGTWFATAPTGKKAGAASSLPGLSVRNDPKLGPIVVDKNGMTVYRFLKDKAWPKSVSNCTGACLQKWPAVGIVKPGDTQGVKKKGLMGFTRPDGVQQMTVNCWPIYTFSGDKAPGDTNGQGVGGTWYAVSPDGKPVGAPGN